MSARKPPVRCIIRFENGRPMRSHIPFDYVDPDLPTLKLLRVQEGLDRLAEAASSEFDLILKVLQYIKEQWDHSWHPWMQHVNALEVLENVRSGLRGNLCASYTHVLLQALWSLGIPCRSVHIEVHHWRGHSTSECWSNEHRKWITVDGDFNLHYVRPQFAGQGTGTDPGPVRAFVPQNALEIQRAWRKGEMSQILSVQGPWAYPLDYADRLGEYYGGSFGFVADYRRVLEHGPPEWAGQRRHFYIWQEKDDPLAGFHRHHFLLTHGNSECHWVSDLEEFYWPLNEVVIEPPEQRQIEGGSVALRFETFTPFFAAFLFRLDGGPWQELQADRLEGYRACGHFRWELGEKRHTFEIRVRNRAGRLGPTALIEVASPPYLPPEPAGYWSLGGRPEDIGGFDVFAGRLYVPRKFAGRVAIVRHGKVEREIGTPIGLPTWSESPGEPYSEPRNFARAAAAKPGHLLAPQACAVAPGGTLYVADAENYRIQPFSPDGSPLPPWGSQGKGEGQFLHIRALAAAPDGSLYVADSGYAGPVGLRTEHVSRLRRFDGSGNLLKAVAGSGSEPGAVCSPAGLHVDREGNLWVADSGNHRVQCFSPDGQVLACWGRPGSGWGELRFPTDVAVGPDGSVFVADPQHRCAWKFSSDGETLARWDRGENGTSLLRPGRLAIEDGRLFVGDVGSGTIHVFRV